MNYELNVLLVSATPFEIAPVLDWLAAEGEREAEDHYVLGSLRLRVLISGVGLPLTAFAMGQVLAREAFDWALQAGVGGAIDHGLRLGDVVEVRSERFSDLGVEEADGRFTSIHALGLVDGNEAPFREGRLWNDTTADFQFLPTAHGISVNKVHGYAPSIQRLQQRFPDAQVESMEGAAFFYACLRRGLPFLSLRAISNYVEPRQRENWDLAGAITALNAAIKAILISLSEKNLG